MKEPRTFEEYVIVTAVEGGINYWAITLKYDWSGDTHIREFDDEGDVSAHVVNAATVKKAIGTMKAGPVPFLANDVRARLVGQSFLFGDALDALDIDAYDADSLIQVGLFGEVKYG